MYEVLVMKKLLAILFLTLSIEHTHAADEIYLDCSAELKPSDGTRWINFIKIDKANMNVENTQLTLYYKSNPDFYCKYPNEDECKKKSIPKYINEYKEKYGEVKKEYYDNLTTNINAYSWKKKFQVGDKLWNLYRNKNGERVSRIFRDNLLYYHDVNWPKSSAKVCKIIDKKEYEDNIIHYQVRWNAIRTKLAEEQMSINKI